MRKSDVLRESYDSFIHAVKFVVSGPAFPEFLTKRGWLKRFPISQDAEIKMKFGTEENTIWQPAKFKMRDVQIFWRFCYDPALLMISSLWVHMTTDRDTVVHRSAVYNFRSTCAQRSRWQPVGRSFSVALPYYAPLRVCVLKRILVLFLAIL